MEHKYNVVELFSGIGSQAKALKNLGYRIKTIGTCEWDIHAMIAYDIIHNSNCMPKKVEELDKNTLLEIFRLHTFSNNGKLPLAHSALKTYSVEVLRKMYVAICRSKNYVDVSELVGSNIKENVDIMTYSFPCQDISNVGAFHGYKKGIARDSGSRSSLLWQVGRVLEEMKEGNGLLPRFLLLENVPALLSKKNIKDFQAWIEVINNLGYVSKTYQLNASSFGLPQNRPRLLMLSVYVGESYNLKNKVTSFLTENTECNIITSYRNSPYFHEYHVEDFLRTDYSIKKFYDEAIECTPNDTESRKRIWDENPKIIDENYRFSGDNNIVRTITTKQDRNPNSGNIFFENGIKGKSTFRYLTPRECMLFMGFTDLDYDKLKKGNLEFHKGDSLFTRDKIYRMAGNSIPVKLLEGIFLLIKEIDTII